MEYAEAYRHHVLPQLEQRIQAAAALVVEGGQSFSAEAVEVWFLADRLGAYRLPPKLREDLEGWIQTRLDEACIAYERPGTNHAAWQTQLARSFAEKNAEVDRLEEAVDYLRTLLWQALMQYAVWMRPALPRVMRFNDEWWQEAVAACCDGPGVEDEEPVLP